MLLWTLGWVCLFELVFSFFSQYIPRSRVAESYMIIVISVFWGSYLLFSKISAPVYTAFNSVKGFPFFHILEAFNICRLFQWLSFWQEWPGHLFIVLICVFLVVSFVECPSMCLLAICMSLEKWLFRFYVLSIFWLGCLFFFFFILSLWVFYMFRILIPRLLHHLQIFFPIP